MEPLVLGNMQNIFQIFVYWIKHHAMKVSENGSKWPPSPSFP
jgi:hypothetical protein